MLKKYAVDQLKEGMVVGQAVYKEDMSVLLGEGTVLNQQMIDSLSERNIVSVEIREEDGEEALAPMPQKSQGVQGAPAKTIPLKEPILDEGYVRDYGDCFIELKSLFEVTKAHGSVDKDSAETLAQNILPLCSGAKAVAHIHNMTPKGEYTIHHSLHVAILAGLMGKWLKMPRKDQLRLITAGALILIGNLRIEQAMLDKEGVLTPDERKIMQEHPKFGHELIMAGGLGEDKEIAEAVLQYHERGDGSGYPRGLVKEEIGKFARILAIMDMYDAMASDRSYAKKRSPFEVFNILSDDIMNGQLDTEFGFRFIRRVCHSLNGNWVKLSNDEAGKIIYIDESRLAALPVVQTMDGEFMDLNLRTDVKVEYLLTSREIEEE
ncbi:HD domain-containing phosphohydrolase [uncultured Selenomonas sp.]|jgi:putative HD-GYP hydrolase domain containing protein|uniref:HD-GYP domain-containing protein n=1 Tax=uncultured Selenomonas sp. TaxID=159275 RepID=UPI0028D36F39|nr:HD domain-containing phosphohydrolase [uncultured Selenomonas sp.]